MAVLLLWVLILAFIPGSDATWCTCRTDVSNAALQKTLDYACGAGADCGPILQNGACFQPNTVLAHCSYAANSYFQRRGQAPGTCDFAGTAMITPTDPSYAGCSYPSTASAAGTGNAPPTAPAPPTFTPTTPGATPTTPPGAIPITPPGATPATPGSPTTFTPGGGVLGGLGPSGSGGSFSPDGSGASAGGLSWVSIGLGLLLLRAWG